MKRYKFEEMRTPEQQKEFEKRYLAKIRKDRAKKSLAIKLKDIDVVDLVDSVNEDGVRQAIEDYVDKNYIKNTFTSDELQAISLLHKGKDIFGIISNIIFDNTMKKLGIR